MNSMMSGNENKVMDLDELDQVTGGAYFGAINIASAMGIATMGFGACSLFEEDED